MKDRSELFTHRLYGFYRNLAQLRKHPNNIRPRINFRPPLTSGDLNSSRKMNLQNTTNEERECALYEVYEPHDIYPNDNILHFLDSTSSWDKDTDFIIQNYIEKYLPEITKTIITHRPFLAQKADQVITLQNHGVVKKTSINQPTSKLSLTSSNTRN